MSHVLSILDDPFTCSAFGLDHSSILLKDILRVRAYWQQINSKHWQGESVSPTFASVLYFCRPHTKLREGNVFTCDCLFGGGGRSHVLSWGVSICGPRLLDGERVGIWEDVGIPDT